MVSSPINARLRLFQWHSFAAEMYNCNEESEKKLRGQHGTPAEGYQIYVQHILQVTEGHCRIELPSVKLKFNS